MYVEAVAGLSSVLVVGLIVRFQQIRLNKMQEAKQDRRACDKTVEVLKAELEKGSQRFEKIDTKLDLMTSLAAEHAKDLAVVVAKIDWIAKQNGYGKK